MIFLNLKCIKSHHQRTENSLLLLSILLASAQYVSSQGNVAYGKQLNLFYEYIKKSILIMHHVFYLTSFNWRMHYVIHQYYYTYFQRSSGWESTQKGAGMAYAGSR